MFLQLLGLGTANVRAYAKYGEAADCSDVTVIDAISLVDVFTTGSDIRAEAIGANMRLVFYAKKTTIEGDVKVPVASLIIQTDAAPRIAQTIAAAAMMARADFIGGTAGCG